MPAAVVNPRAPLRMAGVHIARLDWPESLAAVHTACRGTPVRVFWVYANCINVAYTDARYRAALNAAEFVLNDGAGIELAARALGTPVLANLCGTDWIPAFLARLAGDAGGHRLLLVGSRAPVAERARMLIERRWPSLQVVAARDGYFDDPQAVLGDVRRLRPDVVLVAMGVPRQELWIHEHWPALTAAGVRVAIAGGAILDYLTGAVPRAPQWLRRLRLEWLYRVIREPRRLWRRYLIGNGLFLWRLLLERFGRRREDAAV